MLLEALWDWRDDMGDDASYESDCTEIFEDESVLVLRPPWPSKLPCGHAFVSIK